MKIKVILFFFPILLFLNIAQAESSKKIVNVEAKNQKIASEKARQKCGGYPPEFIKNINNIFSFKCSDIPNRLKSQAEKGVETSNNSIQNQVKVTNDWLYMVDTDDFDDSQVTYAYEGGYYKPGYKRFISLKFSCYVDEKELILSVDIEDFITRKNSPFVMKYRIKPQKASEVLFQTWSNSYTGGFTKDKKEIDKFFKKILKNEDEPKIFIRIQNTEEQEFNARLGLLGAEEEISKVYTDCDSEIPQISQKEKEYKETNINKTATKEDKENTNNNNNSSAQNQVIELSLPVNDYGECEAISVKYANQPVRNYKQFLPDNFKIREKLNTYCTKNFSSNVLSYNYKAKHGTNLCERTKYTKKAYDFLVTFSCKPSNKKNKETNVHKTAIKENSSKSQLNECEKKNISKMTENMCIKYIGKTLFGFNKIVSQKWKKGKVIGLTYKKAGQSLSLLKNPDPSYVAKKDGLYIIYLETGSNEKRLTWLNEDGPIKHIYE